ncbi:MAG TPA: hypothetical protein VKH19_10860 [Gemmatimonadaceae bacterium]|nr:hypothetical protein [Gemmatimonadaceae bacterium]
MKQCLAVALVTLILSGAQPTRAQSNATVPPPFTSKLVSSDSLGLYPPVESPDGRWLLFASAIRSGPTHLWIMPANGGAPRRLTEGEHDDGSPVWFPSGRRIAFTSSRVHAVMTADIDPAAGRLVGAIKRVSLEEGSFPAVSPDGGHIVYLDPQNRLRLIPSTGGPAVTLLDHSGGQMLQQPRFSRDGRYVYVSSRDADRGVAVLLRVPVSGGPATTALVGPSGGPWLIVANPAHDRVIVHAPTQTLIVTLAGDTVAALPPSRGGFNAIFTRDGRYVYKGTGFTRSVVRLIPTGGGKPIDVTSGTNYAFPYAWSADSKRIYSWFREDGAPRSEPGLLVSDVSGTQRRFRSMPIDSALVGAQPVLGHVSADERYWWFTPKWWESPKTIVAYDTKDSSARVVTRTAMGIASGGFDVGPELAYVEQRQGGDGYELRSLRGANPSPPLHTFSHLGPPWRLALHGDRLAFGTRVGDSTVLYVARFAGAEERLMAVAGDVGDLTWSPNGRALAAVVPAAESGANSANRVLFVQLSEELRASGAPRFVPTGSVSGLYWLPDSRSVTMLEEPPNTGHTRVLRVWMDPAQKTVSLTPNEPGPFWEQITSPDGRYVAIPVEKFGSSALWRVDIDAAAKAWREKKGQSASRPSTQKAAQ